jgi:tetratricopeptide (TPR) repeat protein
MPIPKYIDYPLKALAVILIVVTLRIVYLDTMSSYYFRLGEYAEVDGYKLQAAEYYGRGVEYEKDPQYVYKAATTYLQELNDTKKAVYYLDMFKDMSVTNYAHSNGFMALALVKESKLRESLPYLLKEVVVYPLLVGSWYRLAYVQGTLGMKQDAEISFANMMESLKYKNLPPNKRTIYYLLDNPVYDAHPDRIPPTTLKLLNAD